MMNFFEEHLLPCAFKSIFGVDCPICGFQRALLLLVQGDFIGSIKMYSPLLPVLFLIAMSLIRTIKPNRVGKTFLSHYGIFVLAVIMINYTIKLIG
jgi:hypothetical protein